MSYTRNLMIFSLLSCGIIYPIPAALSDMETTTIKTTTVSRVPSTTSYFWVDPLTGVIRSVPSGVPADIGVVPGGAIIIDKSSGKIIGTVDTSGRTIDVLTARAFDPLVAAIDNRYSELNRTITKALNDGTINAREGRVLRAELDKIGAEQASLTAHGRMLSYSEAMSLAMDLNNVGDHLTLVAHTPRMEPLIGSRFMSNDGQVLMVVDNLEYRRLKLAQRGDQEYSDGRLTARQVANLKEELSSLAALELNYKKAGEFDDAKAAVIASRLDRIEAQLNTDIAQSSFPIPVY